MRLFLVMIMLLSSFSAFAGKLDLLLMPGQVIAGHAEFEEQCEHCHETLKKENQSARCMACHDHADVAKDIEQGTGYHGKLDSKLVNECRRCHTDHKGRNEDIVKFDQGSFNHKLTDFELRGAHKGVSCNACHSSESNKYSAAPSGCFDCHENDDSHQGKLGEDCAKCHGEETWKQQQFDHNKDTEFKLVGRHEEVNCKLCHAGEVYKDTPKDCYSCHLINDAHNGGFGHKCESCHSSREWKQLTFSHERDTQFPLKGRHQRLECASCHARNPYEYKTDQTCLSCHEKDDEHRGRNGPECQECHTPESWKNVDFDHQRDTRFPLKGKHQDLVCSACHHSATMDAIKDSGCIDCHRVNDVHNGEQGEQCSDCHVESGWRDQVFFNHDLTRFPLIGLHSISACESCHLDAEYRLEDFRCVTCHEQEDTHEKRFGEACSQCHNPNGWMFWTFDHDAQTDYPLEGAHREIDCHACHLTSLERHTKLSRHCYGCHRVDDVHRGSFGRRCELCHSTETFSDPTIR